MNKIYRMEIFNYDELFGSQIWQNVEYTNELFWDSINTHSLENKLKIDRK